MPDVHRQLLRLEALHDALGGVQVGGAFACACDEAVHSRGARGPRVVGAEQLRVHIGELMARIVGHRPGGDFSNSHLGCGRRRARIDIVVLAAGQTLDGRIPLLEVAEQMIEGPVLEHQHHEMLDLSERRLNARRRACRGK